MKSNFPFQLSTVGKFQELIKNKADLAEANDLIIVWDTRKGSKTESEKILCFHLRHLSVLHDQCPDGILLCFDPQQLWSAGPNVFHTKLFVQSRLTAIAVDDKMKEIIQPFFDAMVKELISGNHSPLQIEVVSALLQIFVLKLISNLENDPVLPHNNEVRIADQYLKAVQQNYLQLKKVADYASLFSIPPNRLNRIVRNVTGNTASYHIQQCVLLEAKRMVLQDQVCLRDVAYHLGFDDLAHFSKYFKKGVGMNFTTFKEAHHPL